jgi:hypothetical protein
MRGVTWVKISEVTSGEWGIGGKPLTTEAVKELAAGHHAAYRRTYSANRRPGGCSAGDDRNPSGVRVWHKADLPTHLVNVRSRG